MMSRRTWFLFLMAFIMVDLMQGNSTDITSTSTNVQEMTTTSMAENTENSTPSTVNSTNITRTSTNVQEMTTTSMAENTENSTSFTVNSTNITRTSTNLQEMTMTTTAENTENSTPSTAITTDSSVGPTLSTGTSTNVQQTTSTAENMENSTPSSVVVSSPHTTNEKTTTEDTRNENSAPSIVNNTNHAEVRTSVSHDDAVSSVDSEAMASVLSDEVTAFTTGQNNENKTSVGGSAVVSDEEGSARDIVNETDHSDDDDDADGSGDIINADRSGNDDVIDTNGSDDANETADDVDERIGCLNNTCLNGGTCIQSKDGYMYECQCLFGFDGSNCEVELGAILNKNLSVAETKDGMKDKACCAHKHYRYVLIAVGTVTAGIAVLLIVFFVQRLYGGSCAGRQISLPLLKRDVDK